MILRGVLFRRNKNSTLDGTPIIKLPPRAIEQERADFTCEERDFYHALEQRTQTQFNKYMRAGRVMGRYVYFLTLLLRLRQACDHPFLVPDLLEGELAEEKIVGPEAAAAVGPENVNEANKELERAKTVFPNEVVERLLAKFQGKAENEEEDNGDGECPICFDA